MVSQMNKLNFLRISKIFLEMLLCFLDTIMAIYVVLDISIDRFIRVRSTVLDLAESLISYSLLGRVS